MADTYEKWKVHADIRGGKGGGEVVVTAIVTTMRRDARGAERQVGETEHRDVARFPFGIAGDVVAEVVQAMAYFAAPVVRADADPYSCTVTDGEG